MGDFAVQNHDDTAEMPERNKNQVEVRGHRVDLLAVETAVLRHPQIAEAKAWVWPDSAGGRRLSVYVVLKEAPAPSAAALQAFLASALPDYMIPSDVIALPAIPLTAEGEVNSTKLPVSLSTENATAKQSISSAEQRLTAIWEDVLGEKGIGLDDNFFDLGGHSILIVALQQRIAAEFGRSISIAEFFEATTIREQAELAQKSLTGGPDLPPGVIALQPNGTRNNIFWVHILSLDLAKAIGDDQPLLYVALTSEDLPSLGEAPDLECISACLVRKIVATQPKGPYTIGGLCLGGILAYEMAVQLRAAGHEVALVVMVDSPNPSFIKTFGPLKRAAHYVPYAVQRAIRLGPRVSYVYLRGHMLQYFARVLQTESSKKETRIAQKAIERAALKYRPQTYDGKVLLLLASERPPHHDFLPAWQAVVPNDLHMQYMEGHHRDLLKGESARSVAEAIAAQLAPENGDNSSARGTDGSDQLAVVQPRKLATA
jgi:thioesterase domain-containing protein